MGSGTSRISQSIEKKNGDEAYKLGNYQEAILWYSISLSMNEENTQNQKNIRCTLLSNRSSAYYMNGQYHLALLDAQNVIELNSNWSKGYFRAAKV